MKLVIDLRLINASGIGTYLKNVLPGILPFFDAVTVLGNSSEIQSFEWSKNVEILAFNAGIYSLKEQIQYPFKIPKCDILWCPHFNVPLLPVKAAKIVVTIHDVYHLTAKASISKAHKKYAQLLVNNAVKKAEVIFTVSEFSKSEILKHTNANAKKIEVVYGGVNKSTFQNQDFKSDLSLPKNYILYVGNIKPHKNLITLLKAYCSFSDAFKAEHPLVFIGKKDGFITKDDLINDFIKNNSLEDYITFTGYVKDNEIPKIYQDSNLFVFPSLYEGFGLPILEALAAGTKVICSNAASLPEIGGDAVLYFDPKNAEELAEKIKTNIDDTTKDSFLLTQSEKQLEKFTWKKSIENHLNAFKKI